MEVDLYNILFYAFAAIAVIGGLSILFTKNLLYAAVSLLFSLLAIAAVYAFAGAIFVSITQILIYIGGVLILIMFGIMLTSGSNEKRQLITKTGNRGIALLLCTFVVMLLAGQFILHAQELTVDWANVVSSDNTSGLTATQLLGKDIMKNYLVPFEIAGMLLLIALIGAAHIAGKTSKE